MPGFDVTVWHGLYAPKGTPKPVIDKLAAALQAALKDPKVKERFAELGTEPVADRAGRRRTRCASTSKSQIDMWTPIIKKAGVYAD